MDMIDTIFNIEDREISIDKDWYYHGFYYNEEKFKSMLQEGVKVSILRKDSDSYGNNGKYYICLSKDKDIRSDKSSYLVYYYYPRFIIDKNIIAFNASCDNNYPEIFVSSILPFRESYYLDEYQAFLSIKPNKIVGLSYNLYQMYDREKFSIEDLKNLKNMIIIMKNMNIELPIIDNSTKLEINKEKVLELEF